MNDTKKYLDLMRESKSKKTLEDVLNEEKLDEAIPQAPAGALERELGVVYMHLADMKREGGKAWGVASLADKKTATKIKKLNSELDSIIKDIRKQIGK